MDYKNLSKVTDDLQSGRKPKLPVSSEGLEISEQRNPLDAIETKAKITDTKPKDSKPVRLVILDSVQIEKIMNSSREERRNFLSVLTDSQRRRFLEAAKNLKKVKDSGFSQKLALLQIDNILANFVFEPSKFNKESLEAFLKEPQAESLDESAITLANLLLEDKLGDNEETEKAIERYSDICSAEGLDSSFLMARAFVEDNEPAEEFEDYEEIEDIPEETVETISESARIDAKTLFAKDSTDSIFSLCDSTVSKFVKRGFSFAKVQEVYDSAFKKEVLSLLEDSTDSVFFDKYGFTVQDILDKKISDESLKSALAKMEENEFVPDTPEPEPSREKTVLEILSDALKAYLDGDSSKLDILSKQTVELEETEVPKDTEDNSEDSSEDDNDDDIDDADDDVDDENSESVGDSVKEPVAFSLKDSVNLANYILGGKIADALGIIKKSEELTAIFDNYDLESSDLDFNTVEFDECSVVNPPLTHQEFQSISPVVPEVMGSLIEQYPRSEVPYVYSWEPSDRYITVNNMFKYFPYKSSMENLVSELNACENPEMLSKIIGSACCSLGDAFKVAAFSNNLNFIDDKFYKKNLASCEWSFDEIPDCISNVVTSPGTIKITISPKDTSLNIFGQAFDLV